MNQPEAARQSLAEWLAAHPEERAGFLSGLSPEEALALTHDWAFWARPAQQVPAGDWNTWLIQAGRGFGKTRPAAEWVLQLAQAYPKCRIALVGQNPKEYRRVMVEGESGLIACSPPWFPTQYEPSKAIVTWPNGSLGELYSAETPDALRGPQFHFAWIDEFAKFRHPTEVWEQLGFGLRLGRHPQVMITTTPRPIAALKAIRAEPGTVITSGSTYENAANVPASFLDKLRRRYEGTRLGRQELYAELLEDTPGALWTMDRLEKNRVQPEAVPALVRIVIAIDPSGTNEEGASEAGVGAAGLGVDGHGYVLHDWSGHYTPGEWGALACRQYGALKADRIIGERNFGGQMVGHTVRVAAKELGVTVAYKDVHASRGKQLRAEPVAALDEQGRVHLAGVFPELEDELTTWTPGMKSPNRLDWMVWALTELMVMQKGELRVLNLSETEQTEDEKLAADQARIAAAAQVVDDAILSDGIFWPGAGR